MNAGQREYSVGRAVSADGRHERRAETSASSLSRRASAMVEESKQGLDDQICTHAIYCPVRLSFSSSYPRSDVMIYSFSLSFTVDIAVSWIPVFDTVISSPYTPCQAQSTLQSMYAKIMASHKCDQAPRGLK